MWSGVGVAGQEIVRSRSSFIGCDDEVMEEKRHADALPIRLSKRDIVESWTRRNPTCNKSKKRMESQT